MYIHFAIRDQHKADISEGTYMRTKFSVGKPYYLEFQDHAFGINKVMIIKAVGWCTEDDKNYAVFTPWLVDSDDYDIVKNNQEPFVVVKSCILKKRVINV